MMSLPAGVPLRADAGTGAPPPAPPAQGGGAADTIHVEIAGGSLKYRLIVTRQDGTRSGWRSAS